MVIYCRLKWCTENQVLKPQFDFRRQITHFRFDSVFVVLGMCMGPFGARFFILPQPLSWTYLYLFCIFYKPTLALYDTVMNQSLILISITINNITSLAHFKKTIIITLFLKKLATTRDFQQCGILRCVDSGEPVQPLLSLETSNDIRSVARQSWSIQATSKGSDQTARMRTLVWAFAGRTYLIVGNLMFRLKYVRHCLCNALYVSCRGRAVTNVGKTCGPTPCFVLAINMFKLN